MRTRMEKYYDGSENEGSRTTKNNDLYKDVAKSELDSFDVNSNMSVLGDNPNSINIDKVREMLDRKYRIEPKRKSISIDDDEEIARVDIDETREYDINSILEKAKENKESSYEIDRLRKLHNTQYDILKNLNISTSKKKNIADEEDTLMELINTITEKEFGTTTSNIDPLDILSDLRGDDNTLVVTGIKEDADLIKQEITAELKDELLKEVKKEVNNTISNTGTFTQSDFDDFNDLKEDVESTKIIIKILIVIIIIAFAVGLIFLANKFFGLGLF